MNAHLFSSNKWFSAVCLLTALFLFNATASAAEKARKYKVQLVWGTNEDKSPDKNHKLLKGEAAEKLAKHFKWKNYFLITEKTLVNADKTSLSEHCELQIKPAGHSAVEVELWGKGKSVIKKSQSLPKGESLILGGDAEGDNSWFVIINEVQ